MIQFYSCIIGLRKTRDKHVSRGQTMVEFTFCLIVILLIIYSLMRIFEWTGKDQAKRRIAHDDLIITRVKHSYKKENPWEGPAKQLDPYFYTPIRMNAIWEGK